MSTITKHVFGKETAEEIDAQALEQVVAKHPYFAAARFLLAKNSWQVSPQSSEVITAGLYIHNPVRLHWLLTHPPETTSPEAVGEPEVPVAEERQPLQSTDESPIAFQSYHTIDYFASQGIRLQQAELGKDRLGQQLKSFTEWLRSMKKLPSTETELPGGEATVSHKQVVESAAHSIETKEVLTEAMAEVWAKQGHTEKAIGIYEKLSLQNPSKSGYFAAKIEQLKAL